MIAKWYHGADDCLTLLLLQGFLGFLPPADLLRCQTQQFTHLFPEEASVAIVNGAIVSQDLHSRHFIAL